jgi:hypothetical protein
VASSRADVFPVVSPAILRSRACMSKHASMVRTGLITRSDRASRAVDWVGVQLKTDVLTATS